MIVVLTIAGSDPSAGAGIQQDMKTITAHGCYGATVITALTSQNTMGVTGVMPVPQDVVGSQLKAVMDDMDIKAVKIGQIPDAMVAHTIAGMLKESGGLPVVYDPVMISTSGRRLMDETAMETVKRELFPLVTLLTPNIPETETLTGMAIASLDDCIAAARMLKERYGCSVLVKGGHAEGEEMKDVLLDVDGRVHEFGTRKVDTKNLHGTGCTLSSAIACNIAMGMALPEAVKRGKDYITAAIMAGRDIIIGRGNGPLGLPEQW